MTITLSTVAAIGEPVGLVGVVIGAVWLILRGKLVPATVVRDMRDDAIRREGEWRAAYETSERARDRLDDQVRELLEHSRVTVAILRSLPQQGGGDNAAPTPAVDRAQSGPRPVA